MEAGRGEKEETRSHRFVLLSVSLFIFFFTLMFKSRHRQPSHIPAVDLHNCDQEFHCFDVIDVCSCQACNGEKKSGRQM